MMYFTVDQLRHAMKRTTTYEIDRNGSVVYRVSYQTKQKASERGRFSRYIVYPIPATQAIGQYTYRATLALGSTTRSKTWKFQIATFTRVARIGSTH